MSLLLPVAGVCRNALVGLKPTDMRTVPLGVSLESLAPPALGSLICRVNGEWIDRASWASHTRPGDVIEWHDVPRDRDSLRSVLQIAAVIAINSIPGLQGSGFALAAARFAATVAATYAINSLLPPTQQELRAGPQETGTAFSASLTGNQARLDQPIWKTCGFDEITPPFACQPYLEYRPREGTTGDDQELDREQYLFALYAVGIGTHDVYPKLGNTPLTRFDDVLLAQYLAPGEAPTMVEANVTTAPEVNAEVMESGRYVGGFAACAPQRTCAAIGIDVVATRGLGKGSDPLTVSWRVETRTINDFGQVLSTWATIATETRTAFTATQQRWSERYTITTPARVEVRVVRTDVQDTDATALHEIAWTGLRAYLDEPAPLHPDCAHYELVIRASGQLSAQASRDLRLIVKSKARTRSGSAWAAASFTRNPAWWLLDLATSNSGAWGLQLTDDRIDLDSFDALGELADDRQDRFDYTFDATVDAWEAMQIIARSMRARVFRRNGLLTIARDGLASLPVTAFTPRNCLPGSMRIKETLRRAESPDAVIVEYRDHRTREWTEIVCPLPGVDEGDVANPVLKRLVGVIGATHAEREGLYEAASLLYRTRTASWTTEMEGMLPTVMSPVRWQPEIPGFGQAGDVVDWDLDTLTLTLSDHVDFTDAPIYLRLFDSDGTITSAVLISPGAEPDQVILPAAPSITVNVDAWDRERTKWMAGPIGADELVKVTAIADGGQDDGAQLFELSGVIDDDRVHTADNALLPGPGDVQDPIGLPDDADDDGDLLLLPTLTDRTISAAYIDGVGSSAEPIYVEFTLRNDGLLRWEYDSGSSSVQSGFVSGQWLLYGEVETSTAALFEARFDLLSENDPDNDAAFTGASFGAWLSLGTSRTVHYETPTAAQITESGVSARVRVRVRDVATSTVQASAVFSLALNRQGSGGA